MRILHSFVPLLLSVAAIYAQEIPKDGLVLWLDAGHVEMKDGQIEQLTDSSGRGNHAMRQHLPQQVLANPVVAKSSAKPQPVLRFDGRHSFFAFQEITDLRTIVWVVSKDPAAFKQKQELFVLGAAKSLDFHPGTHFTDTILHATPMYGSRALQEGKTWLNGKLIDPRATDFPQQLSVIILEPTANVRADQVAKDRAFPDRCWHGELAEILLYNRELSDPERQRVEAALFAKYGILQAAQPDAR